jgi:uncharacterized membrane protein YhaH (DUF805 family)
MDDAKIGAIKDLIAARGERVLDQPQLRALLGDTKFLSDREKASMWAAVELGIPKQLLSDPAVPVSGADFAKYVARLCQQRAINEEDAQAAVELWARALGRQVFAPDPVPIKKNSGAEKPIGGNTSIPPAPSYGVQAMGFGEAIQTVFRKYAVFSGRARRPEYWYWVLFLVLISVFAGILDAAVFDTDTSAFEILVALALLLPNLAVTVRRLHDTDRTGWWILIGALPIIGAIVLFVFACLPGTAGRNRFEAAV